MENFRTVFIVVKSYVRNEKYFLSTAAVCVCVRVWGYTKRCGSGTREKPKKWRPTQPTSIECYKLEDRKKRTNTMKID